MALVITAGASAAAAASGLDAGTYVDANVLSAADLGANPSAGRPASEWYAVTAWRDGWYDGISNDGVGLTRTVTDADGMYAALEDPRVEFVRVGGGDVDVDIVDVDEDVDGDDEDEEA